MSRDQKTSQITKSVIIADPLPIVAESLAKKLESTKEFEVIATFDDSNQAYFSIIEQQPDVVLLDLELTGRGSLAVAEQIRLRLPATHVIFFTSYLTDVFIDFGLQIGMSGYILKSSPSDEILEGIRSASSGDAYFSDAVMERLEYDMEENRYRVKTQAYLSSLTLRQLQVLRHLVRGDSVKEVAKSMTLSERAIESHKYRIMQKLGIHDRVELARFAIREGLMPA